MSGEKRQKAEAHIEYAVYAEREIPGETDLNGKDCADFLEGKIHSKAELEEAIEALRKLGFKVATTRLAATALGSDFEGDGSEEEKESKA